MVKRNFFKWLKTEIRYRLTGKQFKIDMTPEFKADLEALPKDAQQEILEAMKKIQKNPYIGDPVETPLKPHTMTPKTFPSLLKKPVILQMSREEEMIIGRNDPLALTIVIHNIGKLDDMFYLEMESAIACFLHQDPANLSDQAQNVQKILKDILTDNAKKKDYEYQFF